MKTYVNSHGRPAHGTAPLHRWLRNEMESLSTKKDALDSEYPRHVKSIPSVHMRAMAYKSLLEKICRPPSAPRPE